MVGSVRLLIGEVAVSGAGLALWANASGYAGTVCETLRITGFAGVFVSDEPPADPRPNRPNAIRLPRGWPSVIVCIVGPESAVIDQSGIVLKLAAPLRIRCYWNFQMQSAVSNVDESMFDRKGSSEFRYSWLVHIALRRGKSSHPSI